MCFAQWMQNYGSLLLFGATLVLVGITFAYMRSTRKMANTMHEEFELRIKPLVVPYIYKKTTGAMDPLVEVHAINKGSYPVFFSHVSFKWWHKDRPDDYKSNVQLAERYLDKGESHKENIRFDFTQINGISTPQDLEENGMANVVIHFVSINEKKFTKFEDKIIMWHDQPANLYSQ